MKKRSRLMIGVMSYGRFRGDPGAGGGDPAGGGGTVVPDEAAVAAAAAAEAARVAAGGAPTPAPGGDPAPSNVADEWRALLAGNDDKKDKRLEHVKRFTSPQALVDSNLEMQSRWSDSRTTQIPERNDDGTFKDPAAARKYFDKIGVPTDKDGYKIALPQDYKPTPTVEAGIAVITTGGPEIGLDTFQATFLANALAKFDMDQNDAFVKEAEEKTAENKKLLVEVWGGEDAYKQNMDYAGALLGKFVAPEQIDAVNQLRLDDGTLAKDHPALASLFAVVGRQFSNDDTFLAFNGSNSAPSLDSMRTEANSLQDLRKGSAEDRARYESEAVQKRLGTLLTSIEKIEKSAGAANQR